MDPTQPQESIITHDEVSSGIYFVYSGLVDMFY